MFRCVLALFLCTGVWSWDLGAPRLELKGVILKLDGSSVTFSGLKDKLQSSDDFFMSSRTYLPATEYDPTTLFIHVGIFPPHPYAQTDACWMACEVYNNLVGEESPLRCVGIIVQIASNKAHPVYVGSLYAAIVDNGNYSTRGAAGELYQSKEDCFPSTVTVLKPGVFSCAFVKRPTGGFSDTTPLVLSESKKWCTISAMTKTVEDCGLYGRPVPWVSSFSAKDGSWLVSIDGHGPGCVCDNGFTGEFCTISTASGCANRDYEAVLHDNCLTTGLTTICNRVVKDFSCLECIDESWKTPKCDKKVCVPGRCGPGAVCFKGGVCMCPEIGIEQVSEISPRALSGKDPVHTAGCAKTPSSCIRRTRKTNGNGNGCELITSCWAAQGVEEAYAVCNGHGTCSSTHAMCLCDSGYTGLLCTASVHQNCIETNSALRNLSTANSNAVGFNSRTDSLVASPPQCEQQGVTKVLMATKTPPCLWDPIHHELEYFAVDVVRVPGPLPPSIDVDAACAIIGMTPLTYARALWIEKVLQLPQNTTLTSTNKLAAIEELTILIGSGGGNNYTQPKVPCALMEATANRYGSSSSSTLCAPGVLDGSIKIKGQRAGLPLRCSGSPCVALSTPPRGIWVFTLPVQAPVGLLGATKFCGHNDRGVPALTGDTRKAYNAGLSAKTHLWFAHELPNGTLVPVFSNSQWTNDTVKAPKFIVNSASKYIKAATDRHEVVCKMEADWDILHPLKPLNKDPRYLIEIRPYPIAVL